jgi:hypothetical protein
MNEDSVGQFIYFNEKNQRRSSAQSHRYYIHSLMIMLSIDQVYHTKIFFIILCYLFIIFFSGINNASIDLSTPTNMRETPTPNKIPPITSNG